LITQPKTESIGILSFRFGFQLKNE